MGAMRKSDDSKLGEWTTSNMEYGNFYKLKLTVQREKNFRANYEQEDVELKDIHAECKRELEALRKELEQCKAQLRDYNSLMQSPPSSTSTTCCCTSTSCSSSCSRGQQRRPPMVSKLETNCNVEEEEINGGSGSHDNVKQASTFSKTRMHAAARRSSTHTNLKSREQEIKTAATKGGVRIQPLRVGGAHGRPKLGESISHKRKLKEISSSCPPAPTTTLAKK